MALPGSIQALTTSQAKQLEVAFRLLQAGKVGEALASAQVLATAAPRAPDAQQVLAMCYAEAGDVGKADQAFRHALEFAPNNALVLLNYATMLRKSGRLEDALLSFQRAAEAAPDFAKAWIELGFTALQAGSHQQALTALNRALELEPSSALAWHALGNARRAAGEIEAAEGAFRQAVALVPDYASAWVNLGVVLRLLGRTAEAISCFERAAKIGYASAELSDVVTGTLLDSGQLGAAMDQARQLTKTHPDFVPGHLTLAHILWEYGQTADTDAAVAGFRTAVQSRPHNRPLHIAFARFLLSARLAEDALGQIRILRKDDQDPALALIEAEALELLGRSEPAGAIYEQLYRIAGDGDIAFLNAYTRHLLRIGNWTAAADRASAATRIDPSNQEAWAYLGTAWRLLNDPREYWLCDYERLIDLIEVEPPVGFVDTSAFLVALKSTLEPLHQATREPVQQSLRGGSQTPGRLFGRPDPLIAATQSSLLRAIERWLQTLPVDARHPFLMRNTQKVRVSGSWSVRLWSSGNHVNHIHPEGWLSSAFYVALPPSMATPRSAADQAGCIQFGQPLTELGLNLPPRRVVQPAPGRLALFPSYMWHGTVPFEDTQSRLTIAFDMLPLGR